MDHNKDNIQFASLEALIAKLAVEFDQRFEKSRVEADRRAAEFDRKAAKEKEAADRRAAEFDREMKSLQALVKQNNLMIGGMGNNQGAETTEFFFNSLKHGRRRKNLFGQKFDLVIKEEVRQSNIGFEDEYDIMMFNGQAVCILEVKYKADTNDVQQVLRKEQTFRVNYPEHSDKKLYLALASKTFHKKTEKACKDNGITIIKQVGDTIAIYDQNLKTF